MEGEDEDSENPRSFNNAKIYKRMIIIIAGAFMNIVLGLVLMMITLLPQEQFASNTVSSFAPYSYSAVSGLQPDDEIVNINGYAVNTSTDFSFALYTLPVQEVDGTSLEIYKQDCLFSLYRHYAGIVNDNKDISDEDFNESYKLWEEGAKQVREAKDKETALSVASKSVDDIDTFFNLELSKDYPVPQNKETRSRFRTDMKVRRNGEIVTLKDVDFVTVKNEGSDKPSLQIDFYVKPIEKTFGTVIGQTFSQTVSIVRMVWGSLIGIFKGQFGLNDLAGPVGLASTITDVASESLKTSFSSAVMSIVYIMMVITVNLGVVNMLPFPALDGGRFLFLLIEGIFRKPIPRKVEAIVNGIGFALLLILMAFISLHDIWKIVVGG